MEIAFRLFHNKFNDQLTDNIERFIKLIHMQRLVMLRITLDIID